MALDYARFLEVCMREFELAVVDQVEREFEALRALPDDVAKIPYIDGKYNPHAPREEHVEIKQRVIRALCARKLFEFEAPLRCQPLPLCEDERVAFNGSGDYRLSITAEYAMRWQAKDWDRERVVPFFDFILQCAPR